MAQYLPRSFNGLKIIETHNIESKFFMEMTLNDGSLLLKLFSISEYIKYKIYEHRYYTRFDKIFAISEVDKNYLEKRFHLNSVEIIPFGIKNKQIRNLSKTKIPFSMIFVGYISWYPNKDGISWFLKTIYPKLIIKFPKLKFWIIGVCPKSFKQKKIKGVTFFGYINNLTEYYKKASLFVAPIRYGSGIRIKLLEAISYNMDIIATQEAVEGLSNKILDNPKTKVVNKTNLQNEIEKYFSN
jgi:glycosyltransferase involved in cell wall biosynthesis